MKRIRLCLVDFGFVMTLIGLFMFMIGLIIVGSASIHIENIQWEKRGLIMFLVGVIITIIGTQLMFSKIRRITEDDTYED